MREIDRETVCAVMPGLWDITLAYLKIGTVGFGGGFAVVELIHSELVIKRGWLTEKRFENMMALSEVAPGALTVNRLGGIGAMIMATLALILPSFLLIVALAEVFLSWQHNPIVQSAMEGLTAGV